MAREKADPSRGQVMTHVSDYWPRQENLYTLSASATLATAFGAALSTEGGAVLINNESSNTINISVDATTATASNFQLAAGKAITIYGGETRLGKIRLFAASSSAVSLMEFEVIC